MFIIIKKLSLKDSFFVLEILNFQSHKNIREIKIFQIKIFWRIIDFFKLSVLIKNSIYEIHLFLLISLTFLLILSSFLLKTFSKIDSKIS